MRQFTYDLNMNWMRKVNYKLLIINVDYKLVQLTKFTCNWIIQAVIKIHFLYFSLIGAAIKLIAITFLFE